MRKKKYSKSISLPKYFRFLDINKPSSIFQEIYSKTKRNDIRKNTKLTINKTEEFLNIIEDMRLREEMIETDKDYLIKESRKEIKFNQEMLYLFGNKPINYKKAKNLGKIKLDKKIFLNPLEKKEKNHIFCKSKSNENILKLPMINKKKNFKLLLTNNNNKCYPENKIFNSEGNSRKLSLLDDSGLNTNNDDSKKNDSIFTYYSQKNKKKKNINSFLSSSSSRNIKIRKQSSSMTVNSLFKKNKNSSDVDILNDFTINKKIKKPVIHLLNNINEELKTDEIKHKLYFRKNDYGCELSKFKIKYLEKHFFQ